MIVNFYDNFKKQIIYSELTFNKNCLIETVGKDNYFNFNERLQEIYNHISEILNSYKTYNNQQKEKILGPYKETIDDIIYKMLEHKKIESENPENIDAYLQYLENLGYKVKRSDKTL